MQAGKKGGIETSTILWLIAAIFLIVVVFLVFRRIFCSTLMECG